MAEYQQQHHMPPTPPKPSFANRIKIKLEYNELKTQFYQANNLKESLFHDLSEKQAKEFKLRMECDLILDQIELIRSRMPPTSHQATEDREDPELKRLRKYQESTNGFMWESDEEIAGRRQENQDNEEEEEDEAEEEEEEEDGQDEKGRWRDEPEEDHTMERDVRNGDGELDADELDERRDHQTRMPSMRLDVFDSGDEPQRPPSLPPPHYLADQGSRYQKSQQQPQKQPDGVQEEEQYGEGEEDEDDDMEDAPGEDDDDLSDQDHLTLGHNLDRFRPAYSSQMVEYADSHNA